MRDNGVMLQAFEWDLKDSGTHWNDIKALSGQLRSLGFTAVWLPPAQKCNAGIHDVGYGVYDLYDLGEFNQKNTVRTKYGTAAQYLAAIKSLKAHHIMPIADIVLNHRMGADTKETATCQPVNPDNRAEKDGSPLTGDVYTGFTFPGRNGKYSKFKWDAHCFTGVDTVVLHPEEGKSEVRNGVYLLNGKDFAQDVSAEKGNFDYLMGANVDMSCKDVQRELTHWGFWFVRKTGIEGFRLDACKHISREFMKNWLDVQREHSGKELFSVGEYWSNNLSDLQQYIADVDRKTSLFDVCLHYHFQELGNANGNYDLRALFSGTLVNADPQLAVTFVDNHDTQPGQALESWIPVWLKAPAYALILLRDCGFPCVFWGDLYGIPAKNIGRVSELPTLLHLRDEAARGPEHDYFDEEHLLGFTREGEDDAPGSGLAMLFSCRDAGEKRMFVSSRLAGQTLVCRMGHGAPVKLDSEGCGTFRVDAGQFCVYTPKRSLFHALRWQVRRILRRFI